MGIVLGVVADVVVASAAAGAEAAAAAGAEAAAAAGAEAAAAAGAEAAAAAGAEAAAEAAAETAAEAAADGAAETVTDGAAETAESALDAGVDAADTTAKVLRCVAKLMKVIKEFCEIDAIFKAAEAILKSLCDAKARENLNRLHQSLNVLTKLTSKMKEFGKWLEEHQEDEVKLDGIDVPLESGILSKFMKPLSVAAATLQRLSKDVSSLNQKNQMMTDAQLTTLHRSVIRVVATFESLAKYKEEKSVKFPALSSLPISMNEVGEWRNDLGCEEGSVLTLLKCHTYK